MIKKLYRLYKLEKSTPYKASLKPSLAAFSFNLLLFGEAVHLSPRNLSSQASRFIFQKTPPELFLLLTVMA